MPNTGWVFVSVDHLGVGESSLHSSDQLTFAPVIAAAEAAESEVRQRLTAGTLMDTLDPVTDPLTLGIGQSMGGAFTIVQQGRHHGYDGVGILGYSPLRTQPPTAPGAPSLTFPWVPRDTQLSEGILTNGPALAEAAERGGQRSRAVALPPDVRNRWHGLSTSTTSTRPSYSGTWRTTPPGTATSRRGDPPPFQAPPSCGAWPRGLRWPRRPPSEHPSSSRLVSVTSSSIRSASHGRTSRRPASTSSSARAWRTCTTLREPAGVLAPALTPRGRDVGASGAGRSELMDLKAAEDLPSLLTLRAGRPRPVLRVASTPTTDRSKPSTADGWQRSACLPPRPAVEPQQLPHSFPGYFLRAGASNLPVVLEVDRDRDRRSFSAHATYDRRPRRRSDFLHDHVVPRRERGWGLRRRAPAKVPCTGPIVEGRVEHAPRCTPH